MKALWPVDVYPVRYRFKASTPVFSMRLWSVRHARSLRAFYSVFLRLLTAVLSVFRRTGISAIEGPITSIERITKGTLFDCRMCGQCIVSSTGMSCPMNCPKALRNGPCGGVRANGHCEVHPSMRCVWVQAYNGAQIMRNIDELQQIQPPLDYRKSGQSSWIEAATQGRKQAR